MFLVSEMSNYVAGAAIDSNGGSILMKINAFIPVRMSSSRFPGKPLTKLLKMTMLEHVWRRTKMSDVDETYVALCDKETVDICKKIGAKYIITSKKHEMCMDRIAELLTKKSLI